MAPRKKPVSGSTDEKVKRLEAELDSAQLQLGQRMREVNELRLLSSPGLMRDAYNALSWALRHPDYFPGGKHYQGAVGTAAPVLRALELALGLPTSNVLRQQAAEVPAAEEPAQQPEPEGDAGEQPAG